MNAAWKVYQDYREILDREPVDALVRGMRDDNRILPAIHACQAAKDIYVEKPFCLYVAEGRALVQAVRRDNRICQYGTQLRTIGTNQAVLRMIRQGKLGKLAVDRLPQLPREPALSRRARGTPAANAQLGQAVAARRSCFPTTRPCNAVGAAIGTTPAEALRSSVARLRHDPSAPWRRHHRTGRTLDDQRPPGETPKCG